MAEVLWTSGAFFGCRFREQISQAALSATLLRAEPQIADNTGPADTMRRAAVELRQLSSRVQQLCSSVEVLIERLSGESLEWPQHSVVTPADSEQAEDSSEDDRLSFANRLRIILALSLGMWALILWAVL